MRYWSCLEFKPDIIYKRLSSTTLTLSTSEGISRHVWSECIRAICVYRHFQLYMSYIVPSRHRCERNHVQLYRTDRLHYRLWVGVCKPLHFKLITGSEHTDTKQRQQNTEQILWQELLQNTAFEAFPESIIIPIL